MLSEIPLFPLNTVLFPRGALPLRIFETRYLDMVSDCLKRDQGFGVCLIQEGKETGKAKMHTVGTLAEIGDWSRGEDGLLHIVAQGKRRLKVAKVRTQGDGLNLGEVEILPEDPLLPVPDTQRMLPEILRQVLQQAEVEYPAVEYADAAWVGNRLAEVLPISLPQRQYLLEVDDPLKRLEILATLVQSLSVQ
ncbi:MAG TPA: LON peptidase substrate-binding domain-containing protein [Gammaproteobacteria bacterium]|nr:LON peptidase substrate-binding domain-containing protein [Gammaproteobacteria bacterium]